MSTAKGKALLVITRREDTTFGGFRWDVTAFIQSCDGDRYARAWVEEEFGNVEWDSHPAPPQAYKMEVGETLRVSVVYFCNYWTDYWGEGDSSLEYEKVRVLRRQRPKIRYISKQKRKAA
jgi:hypothetical protein